MTCQVEANEANDKGGVAALEDDSTFVVDNCTLRGNKAFSGGVVALSGIKDIVPLAVFSSASVMEENVAEELGGVAYVYRGGAVEMRDITAASNGAGDGGVVHFTKGGSLRMERCMMTGNVATPGSGGVLKADSTAVMIESSTFDRNAAADAGGMANVECYGVDGACELNISTSWLVSNVARESFGGAVNLVGDGVVALLVDNVMDSNTAEASSGGALQLKDGARVQMQGGSVSNNSAAVRGGGVSAYGVAVQAELTEVLVEGNSADSGGGFAVDGEAALVLRGGSCIRKNVATENGGGISVSAEAMLEVRQESDTVVTLSENQAAHGGAVYMASSVLNISIWGAQLHANLAGKNGGALYFESLFLPKDVVVLREINFTGNAAKLSGAASYLMSEADSGEGLEEVTCGDCIGLLTADNATSPMFYQMLHGTTIMGESGVPLSPAPVYQGVDHYGHVVVVETAVAVAALISDNSSSKNFLTGPQSQIFVSSVGAAYDGLTMSGTPGESYMIQFSPSDAAWSAVGVEVVLNMCPAGSFYNADSQRCFLCVPGTLKFTNDTSMCITCSDYREDVTCNGAWEYAVDDGSWVAPAAALCDPSDPACVLDRIYECDVYEACDSSESGDNRTNVDAALQINASLVCGEGYRDDVVLCSACKHNYEALIGGVCRKCPDHPAVVWFQFITVTGVICLCIGALAMYLPSAGMTLKVGMDTGLKNIMAGFVQVISQSVMIYDAGTIPKVFQDFLSGLFSVISISLLEWVGLRCVMSTIYTNEHDLDNSGGFYWSFTFYTLIPMLPLGSVVGLYLMGYLSDLQREAGETVDMSLAKARNLLNDEMRSSKISVTSNMSHSTEEERPKKRKVETPSTAAAQPDSPQNSHDGSASRLERKRMPSEVLRLNKSHKRKLREKLGRNFGSDIQLGDIYLPPPDLPTGESTDDRQKLSLLAHGRPSTGDASPDAMNRKGEEEKKNRKLLFESRLRMYLGLMSFMLTFMHPSVSTFMFQLFNCDKIFFDQDEAQWWLAIDRRLECFTAEWSGYASMATLVICVYVLGLPLGIFVSTSYFDRLLRPRHKGTGGHPPSMLSWAVILLHMLSWAAILLYILSWAAILLHMLSWAAILLHMLSWAKQPPSHAGAIVAISFMLSWAAILLHMLTRRPTSFTC
ncbi:hypothetical protein CYMTET_35011 [Cymbomonas tetramitiformis]|uniref:Right handed beta helix domain-containing protein n=1 Tax=Cymbomonas tetramitiformis TaxID=36881 RepID=A0AAE0FAI3_9CHLO|nr:hypothetical protein CYMTET_35011 [Cymbomonas tetramitiformis]